MGRVHVFGDEAGDLVFKPPSEGISRYFVIGTITVAECSIGERLLELRRELAWNGLQLDQFHATSDKQRVRDRVFSVIADADLRFDATILDKRKTQDHLRADELRFYKQAWHLHFKFVAPKVADSHDELLVVASSLQIKRRKKALHTAIHDVVNQASPTVIFHTAFSPAMSDPCLQVADYLTWAVQRKHERDDTRSYDLIKHLIASEYEPFRSSPTLYY